MMGDLALNIPESGYIKSLYELDELNNHSGNGEAVLEKSSQYLTSFDGIPRAKIEETDVSEPMDDVRL